MPRCPRCGQTFERLTVDQRYDPRCAAEVAAREAHDKKPEPAWQPAWLQRAEKDLSPTGRPA